MEMNGGLWCGNWGMARTGSSLVTDLILYITFSAQVEVGLALELK